MTQLAGMQNVVFAKTTYNDGASAPENVLNDDPYSVYKSDPGESYGWL